jgi:hypothetical protein
VDDIMKYISEEITQAPIVGNQTIPGLMFADNLAIGSFAASGLQIGIDWKIEFCNKWYLTCKCDKTKFMLYRNGGKLKNRECWYLNRQKIGRK